VGTRDGRTQSARACKPALLHLALRTLGFRTSVFGSEDLGFRTSINGDWVSLSGPGFQDLDKRALGFTLRTWVSGPRKLSILRSSYFFPVTFLSRPVFPSLFSASSGHRRTDAPKRKAKKQRKERLRPLLFPEENPFVCPSVRPSVRAGSAIENASRWSVIGRAGSAVENASRTPNHPRT
jgi:hypothetical protein